MQPSSLIFVVVVAVWALYLVQHWVRRREYLATARSVDRFSEAIRLLNVPVVRHDVVDVVLDESSGAVSGSLSQTAAGRSPLVARVSTRASSPDTLSAPADHADTSDADRDWSVIVHRVLGVGFVLALPGLVGVVVLAALGRVPWLSVGIAVIILGALTLGLGRVATLRRSQRAARRRAALDIAAARREASAQRAVASSSDADSSRSAAVAEPAPGSWTPVPVPRPTYAMKAKAERPVPRDQQPAISATVTSGVPDASPGHLEVDADELPLRRTAGA